LNKARAIENTCYVISSGQTGFSFPKRSSFGHSLVIDPWGKVLLDMKNKVGVDFAQIDIQLLSKIRKSLPCIKHRRDDLY